MLTRYDLEAVTAFRSEHYLATTLYLPLDVEQPPQFPILLRGLTSNRGTGLSAQGLSPAVLAAARQDLDELERYAAPHMDRAGARALAVFCCIGEGYWRAYNLPLPPPARLIQDAAFHVRPLAVMLGQYPRILFALSIVFFIIIQKYIV